MNFTKSAAVFLALSTAIFGAVPAALSQEYPDRPITLIVPYGAGSGTDLNARFLASALSAELGQPVVVENRAGGGGVIGVSALYNSTPDGYTIGIGTGSNTTIAPHVVDVAYDPLQLTYIGNYYSIPFMVITNAKLPVENVDELIAYGLDNPGGIVMATSGGFGSHDVAMAMFAEAGGGIEYRTLPNESAAETTTRILAGDANLTFGSPATNMEHIAAGNLRAIGIISDVSTPEMDALGLDRVEDKLGFSMVSRTVLMAPPGLPADIQTRLEDAMEAVLANPDLVKQVADLGYVAEFKSGEDTRAETADLFARYGEIIEEILPAQ